MMPSEIRMLACLYGSAKLKLLEGKIVALDAIVEQYELVVRSLQYGCEAAEGDWKIGCYHHARLRRAIST